MPIRPRLLRALRLAAFLAAAGLGALAPARAQNPAQQPIRLVVPFAAGCGTNLIARVLGAGTIIGSDFVAKSPPDGHTLLVATFAHAVNPSLQPKMLFNTATALAPVSLIARSPNVLVVAPDRPFKTVKDIVVAAQRGPRKLTYSSFGNGTSAHLAAELFKSLAKVDITHVPYRGSSPAITDLLGSQIDMMFTTVASVAPYLQSGKLRAIAVTSAARTPAMPGVPTVAEGGVHGYVAESWYGLYAPASTSPEAVQRLLGAVRKAVAGESFRKRVEEEGLVVTAAGPQELAAYVAAEQVRWAKVVRDARITAN